MAMLSISGFVLTFLLAYLVYRLYGLVGWCFRIRKWLSYSDSLPGTDGHWLLGHVAEVPNLNQEGMDYVHSFVHRFPRMFKARITRFLYSVILHHPATVKRLLKMPASVSPKPRGVTVVYKTGLPWLGEGLLLSSGDVWSRDRRLLTPSFHFEILQQYMQVLNNTADVLLEKMETYADSGRKFEMTHHMGLLALDNMLQCMLSYPSHCQVQGEKHPYVKAVHRLSDLWTERNLKLHYYHDWLYFNVIPSGREFIRLCNFAHDFTEKIISTRRQALEEKSDSTPASEEAGGSRNLDFLDVLLKAKDETGLGLSDTEIRNEVDTALFAGHDTTASGMSFTLLSLAQHPEIQEKIRHEVDTVLDGQDTDSIHWKDLPKLEYLTRCIKEGLRLHSPVYMIVRTIMEDLPIDGLTIPAGTPVAVSIYNLHHNPAVWGEDHWEYKPDRFLPDSVRSMDPFAFIPFSGGQRNCIGQNFAMNEMKVTIAKILHRYSLHVETGVKVRKKMSIVTRPETEILVTVRKRR